MLAGSIVRIGAEVETISEWLLPDKDEKNRQESVLLPISLLFAVSFSFRITSVQARLPLLLPVFGAVSLGIASLLVCVDTSAASVMGRPK